MTDTERTPVPSQSGPGRRPDHGPADPAEIADAVVDRIGDKVADRRQQPEIPSVDQAIKLREQAPELYDLWLKVAKENAETANYVDRAPYEIPERLAQSGRPRALGALVIVLSFCGYLAWLGGPGPYIAGLIAILDLIVMFGMFFGLRPERLPDTQPPDPHRRRRPPRLRWGGRWPAMLEGNLLVDAHVHVARLPTLSADWRSWVSTFGGGVPLERLYSPAGVPLPAAIDEHFAAEGADHVLLFSEYSPKSTGIQPVEDVLPLVDRNPARFRPVANINPHLHYPPAAELARQVGLGAVACKIHPVHGGFHPADRMLYPAYSWAEEHGLPVIVHCGTSTFSGSANRYGEPALLDPVLRDFPGLTVVLAHGGRGWWYSQAAFLALMRPGTWLEVSGLPPHRLPDYYGPSLPRLATKMIFGTDWPGVPGVQRNARALQKVLLEAGCPDGDVAAALGGNAARVFRLG